MSLDDVQFLYGISWSNDENNYLLVRRTNLNCSRAIQLQKLVQMNNGVRRLLYYNWCDGNWLNN